jgi:hypothetical protein
MTDYKRYRSRDGTMSNGYMKSHDCADDYFKEATERIIKDMKYIPDSTFDWLAQKSHILGGLSAVLLGQLFGSMKGALICGFIIILFAAIKEFYYDERYESTEERGSNLRDFAYYCVGVALGFCFVIIATKYQF